MRQLPDDIATARRGFVLPVVLGLVVIAALVAAHAVSDLGTDTSLATMRLMHQRAFEASQSGVAQAVEQLAAGSRPPADQLLSSPTFPTDRARVSYAPVLSLALPAGYSAGRVVEVHGEIRSEGESARNARVVVVQGMRHFAKAGPP